MTKTQPRWLFVLLALACLGVDAPPEEPAFYRLSEYRADVPATLNGVPALTTEQAATLWRQKTAVFIDTLPQPPHPAGLPMATIWHPKPRYDIPGSVWLPDVGYGALSPAMDEYFRAGLQKAAGDNQNRVLVFYCLARCWMSWNAGKRATSFGYQHVAWFADGTDGWVAQGLPLELRDPVPRPE